MLGATHLGRIAEIEFVELLGWFRGRWMPTGQLDQEVQALFAPEHQWDTRKCRAAWEGAWSRGISLAFGDGSRVEHSFVVCLDANHESVDAGDDVWLTYWGSHPDRPALPVGLMSRDARWPSVNDPTWRQAVDEALAQTGELVCETMRDMGRRLFLVHTQSDLQRVLGTVSSICPYGKSDGIAIYPALEPLHRSHDFELSRVMAREVVARPGISALVAVQREGNPELDGDLLYVLEEVDEWFDEPHEGTCVVGPVAHEREEAFAYGLRADDTVLPGSF
jgi:hypothetical protein